jgi:hypothetical protein
MFRRLFAGLIAFLVYGAVPSDADTVTDDAGESDEGKRPPLVESSVAGPLFVKPGQFRLASEFEGARHTPLVASSFQYYVGVINLAGGPGAVAVEDDLVRALSACRDRGDLKIQVTLGGCDAEVVRQTCERHGFMFSKRGPFGAEPAMEFYTDLYYQSPPARGAAACRSASRLNEAG